MQYRIWSISYPKRTKLARPLVSSPPPSLTYYFPLWFVTPFPQMAKSMVLIFGLMYNTTPQVQTWWIGPKFLVLYTRFYGKCVQFHTDNRNRSKKSCGVLQAKKLFRTERRIQFQTVSSWCRSRSVCLILTCRLTGKLVGAGVPWCITARRQNRKEMFQFELQALSCLSGKTPHQRSVQFKLWHRIGVGIKRITAEVFLLHRWRKVHDNTSGSRGARTPLAPKICPKSCSFQENPLFWANFGLRPPPLGVKTPLGFPWPKSWIRAWIIFFLKRRYRRVCFKSVREWCLFRWVLRIRVHVSARMGRNPLWT